VFEYLPDNYVKIKNPETRRINNIIAADLPQPCAFVFASGSLPDRLSLMPVANLPSLFQ